MMTRMVSNSSKNVHQLEERKIYLEAYDSPLVWTLGIGGASLFHGLSGEERAALHVLSPPTIQPWERSLAPLVGLNGGGGYLLLRFPF